MKKSHQSYLRRIIGKAIAESNLTSLTDKVLEVKTPSSGIYQMMRDIVCDARFYSVLDKDAFWKTYGTYKIGCFVDSISAKAWEENVALTMLKEDFLNNWMTTHMMPISEERRNEIEADIRLNILSEDGVGMPDPDDRDGTTLGIINLGNGIKDSTNRTGEPTDGLPTNLRDYMEDATGGTTPELQNDGHKADARFLKGIDPSIAKLAEKIGRRSVDIQKIHGKFKPAPKSDISGVTVGNDLNSLLPSELALLASQSSERIFLDRYVRKELQTFSSVSAPKSEKTKRGPIYICIDTSGSMVGEPECLAKTLALAISVVAQKDHRPVCIFNYSGNLSFFVLKDLDLQRKNLLRFLSDSYGGSNDENKLFRFLFGRLPGLSIYKKIVNEHKGADMLVISDFLWNRIEKDISELIDSARGKGMRIFSVGITSCKTVRMFDNDEESKEYSRMSSGYRSGMQFYLKSDFRYKYDEGRLKEDFR